MNHRVSNVSPFRATLLLALSSNFTVHQLQIRNTKKCVFNQLTRIRRSESNYTLPFDNPHKTLSGSKFKLNARFLSTHPHSMSFDLPITATSIASFKTTKKSRNLYLSRSTSQSKVSPPRTVHTCVWQLCITRKQRVVVVVFSFTSHPKKHNSDNGFAPRHSVAQRSALTQ